MPAEQTPAYRAYAAAADALQEHYTDVLVRAEQEFNGDEDKAWDAMDAQWRARYTELNAARAAARANWRAPRDGEVLITGV